MIRNEASQAQVDAANPHSSTWLAANAGSGKTRVLTDRVARLLLGGVNPQNILCLTYTKAAASEMQNRLFARLGDWAMKSDADLTAALVDLGIDGAADLPRARRLFARAIETPGGLKIQTIHSFCSSLLRRFPLESGVSPQFTEMDERAASLLQSELVEEMADGPDRALVAELARFYTGEDFVGLTAQIVRHRDGFSDAEQAEVWSWFELDADYDEARLTDQAFAPGDGAMLAALIPLLAAGSKTEQAAAAKLGTLDGGNLTVQNLPVLENVFLTGAKTKQPFSAKIGSFPTKGLREGAGAGLMPGLEGLMARVEAARPLRNSLYSARKTLALHRFAQRFIDLYEIRKLTLGWLDFDDLIRKAGALLSDPAVATWVLYRLDGGIDHILVDEAQDTSPAQWQVIERLAAEFTSGEGAKSGEDRTIFVVGDPKQSIYSFQGAEPAEFTRMRDKFRDELQQIGQPFQAMQLQFSFRSSPAVLGLVDHTLEKQDGLGESFLHRAFFHDKPGRVDLWPVVEKVEHKEDRDWFDPVDRPDPQDHLSTLARAIAADIAEKLKTGSITSEKGETRPIEPKDIMILVRRRSPLFFAIISACKELGLPIAGADLLRIGGELAVKDLVALLSFLATPEDDLSLAAALRSPLFGWSEAQLYALAQGRGKLPLWRVLEERGAQHADTHAILRDLRDQADFLRPYDLLERVLIRHDGRRRLLARLGSEAEDGIDALLSQALAYERLQVPSLTGFLIWMEAEEVTIKRQVDSASNQVRVMTVHGSKGLEATIVYLPDTTKPHPQDRDEIVEVGGHPWWKPPATQHPDALAEVMDTRHARDREEWVRLLYVAMTRAEQWLIVAAAGEVGKTAEDSWYGLVAAGLDQAGAVKAEFPTGTGKRFETGTWAPRPEAATTVAKQALTLPEWAHTPAPHRSAESVEILAPSDLGGAKVLPGAVGDGDTEAAMTRGSQVHLLLEHLPLYPEADWPDLAARLLGTGELAATPADLPVLLAEVTAVLKAPDLAPLFAPDALAEVELTAPVGDKRLHGAIDRLVVTPDRVLAVDFKTNTLVPDRPEQTPEGLLRQMGAYHAALAQVFPDRPVETAILWTRVAKLMPLPNDLVMRTFGRLDGTGNHT
ncbi:double-strand break repair helicase AddA [Aliiroseovarius sp.]|uniref:double-strand break repair helicase AddA n=1 Tax=Aliiroseovarius sp. TaxID=1872442 RepID=UPI00260B7042|nr:double-strand break repair helicase AddA [Aliiroseovarius sp.]